MTPKTPDDLIGPAHTIAKRLCETAYQVANDAHNKVIRLLLYGPTGSGKSAIGQMVSKILLGGHTMSLEHLNGKQIDVARMREWMDSRYYSGTIWSNWRVRLIDEVDLASIDAQNLMLTLLDTVASGNAFICTSNMDLNKLQERFRTRFQQIKVLGPSSEEIEKYLIKRCGADEDVAQVQAFDCGGNMRLALANLKTATEISAAFVF